MRKAFIVGLAGPVLAPEEVTFLREERPAGIILFARNCVEAGQLRALVCDSLEALGTDRSLVLIDQEGGRVQRLKPPLASLLPPAAAYLAYCNGNVVAAAHLARLGARLVASELKSLGINTNCAPVLDLAIPGAHAIIGNRAYAADPATVSALGGAVADGLIAGGVLPVMKHIPGHGRAGADSHLELPVVGADSETLWATDFEPFRILAHIPAAMTAHVVYTAVDPSTPASTSRRVTAEVIRKGMGFAGLLMSDDLGMRALTGTFGDRARAVLDAGSDIALHCSGDLGEMRAVAAAVPALDGRSSDRFERALAVAMAAPAPFDCNEARRALEPVLARNA